MDNPSSNASNRTILKPISEEKEMNVLGLPNNFTACPICQKMLRTPKCLPCLHSVCMRCLHLHIMASERTATSFPCPVCKETTPAPVEATKPDEWAEHYKSNPLVDAAMDAKSLKQSKRKCDPCKNTRKRSLAVTWCSLCREALCVTCTNSHRGMRLTRGHAIIDISAIETRPVFDLINDEKCPDHEDQFLQFFCQEHKTQCCPTCVIAVHRRCNNVLEMAKLGKEIREQQKAEKLLRRLKACIDVQRDISDSKVDAKDSLTSKKQAILREIQDLKHKLVRQLNEMEAGFIKEFDFLHEDREIHLQAKIDECRKVSRSMEKTATMLEAAIKYASDSQLFATYETIQDECRRYEKLAVAYNKETKKVVYNFKMDDQLNAVVNKVTRFGHLSAEQDDGPDKCYRECTVRETSVFGARAHFSDFRGVDIFPNGDIIVADHIGKSALLFRSSGEYVCHISFKVRPWGIAVLGVRTASVSLPVSHEIHILKSSYRGLEDYKVIETGINCYALTNFAGEYLALQHEKENKEKGRVQIAQSDKQLDHKVAIDITANHDNVQGIAYDEATGQIFVTTNSDAIECYNPKGRILFRKSYQCYGDFRGLCVDRESNVYVASYTIKGVLQLTSAGELVRLISTSPLAPLDVAMANRGNRLVAVGTSDLIYVYTFK